MQKCSMCGAPVDGPKCSYCGATTNYKQENKRDEQEYSQQSQPQQPIVINNIINNNNNGRNYIHHKQKSKIVALLLCIFFGYFGAHKFYLGKSGMGILYFFTAGLLGIGWIVDIILILTGSARDNYGYPLI